MKRYFAAFAALVIVSVCCFAQGERKDSKPRGNNNWEEIKAEKETQEVKEDKKSAKGKVKKSASGSKSSKQK